MLEIPPDQIWMVIVGFIVAFALAFGIGANDVANSFGTSVGSKVLTLRQACIVASIFETLGAVLLGAKVSDTIRKGIIELEPYQNETDTLMLGNVAALGSSCIWMLSATFLRVPVSASHSIVGATVGFALVAHGTIGIHWKKLGLIMGSWFISPVLSGAVSTLIFYICRFFILSKADPLEPGLAFLPIFYGCTVIINLFSIFYEGPKMFMFHLIPIWGTFIISVGAGLICAVLIRIFLVPWQRKKIKGMTKESSVLNLSGNALTTTFTPMMNEDDVKPQTDISKENDHVTKDENSEKDEKETALVDEKDSNECKEISIPEEKEAEPDGRSQVQDRPETAKLFSFLQILTAVFGSFAHGGNDVSNAIGPLVNLWLVAATGQVNLTASTPVWILFCGGIGISIGLWVLGPRVIKTIGEDLAKITPSSGFCIEIGSAFTVLVASNVGIPISTTHCKIGSIVFVGRFRSKENVDWSIFRNIILAWLVTLPITGLLSAALMALLRLTQ